MTITEIKSTPVEEARPPSLSTATGLLKNIVEPRPDHSLAEIDIIDYHRQVNTISNNW